MSQSLRLLDGGHEQKEWAGDNLLLDVNSWRNVVVSALGLPPAAQSLQAGSAVQSICQAFPVKADEGPDDSLGAHIRPVSRHPRAVCACNSLAARDRCCECIAAQTKGDLCPQVDQHPSLGNLHPGLPTERTATRLADSEVMATSALLEMVLVARLPEMGRN